MGVGNGPGGGVYTSGSGQWNIKRAIFCSQKINELTCCNGPCFVFFDAVRCVGEGRRKGGGVTNAPLVPARGAGEPPVGC